MRRFRQGATNGPSMLRPGAGYGRLCFGAPGPTQEVEPREELHPELFTGEVYEAPTFSVRDFLSQDKCGDLSQDKRGDTIIDLTNE
ncbi:MAG TPA: hypothetical protein PKB15_00485 [Acidimicrobiia bacterium]|nr:hypothetical protein [Acidimicrobiia bacterium]